VGRAQGSKNRGATEGVKRNRSRDPNLGHAFVHTVVDDHSRAAYAEIHDNETAETAIGVLPARWAGLAPAESALNVSCLTTADATAPAAGVILALSCKFSTSGRGSVAAVPICHCRAGTGPRACTWWSRNL
jgi:hypothetical protein